MSIPYDIPLERLCAIVKTVMPKSGVQSSISIVASKEIGNIYVPGQSYTSLPSFFEDEAKATSGTTVG